MDDPRGAGDLWDDWLNAEVYREYVADYPLYTELNRRLAELADLGSARRVLDLGCGTGATTVACLRYLPADAEVVAVDRAPTMLEVARAQVQDPRAHFQCVDATELAATVSGSFDRAVSNAAFWMFPDSASVLGELAVLLDEGAILAFNIPAQRLAGHEAEPDPFQKELAVLLIDRIGPERLSARPLYQPSRIDAALTRHGFELELCETYRHRCRQRELIELMRIPAMAARLVPYLSAREGLEIVAEAAARSDPEHEVEVPWVFYRARRSAR